MKRVSIFYFILAAMIGNFSMHCFAKEPVNSMKLERKKEASKPKDRKPGGLQHALK